MAVEPASIDRVPPHNIDAEESVLGSMIYSHRAVAEVQEIISADDFYKESHSKIFETLLELYARGATTDPVVLCEELRRKGILEAVGDRAYIFSLVGSAPNPANARHYAEIVRQMAIRRRLIDIGYEIASIGYSAGEDAADAYDRSEMLLFDLGKRMRREGLTPIKKPLMETFHAISEAMEKGTGLTGLPTGFAVLDRVTSGLQPSNLIVVGGRTAMGKTSFALSIAHHVSVGRGADATGVLIFSLEMSARELSERFLCMEARIDANRLRSGNVKDKWGKIVEAAAVLNDAPISIMDAGDISLMEMRTIARQQKAKADIGLIIVDYIQLMYAGRAEARRFENRAQEVSKIARDLKAMAMELEIPVIAVSQLRRPGAQVVRKEPTLEDLKESSGVEQNADVVLLLYRPFVDEKSEENKGLAYVNLAKHRNGETGKFKLAWVGEYTKFEDLETEEGLIPA